MTEEELKALIGKTVASAKMECDGNIIVLAFTDGTVLRGGMTCGDTSEDYPYSIFYLE